jgi:hypothetical protein
VLKIRWAKKKERKKERKKETFFPNAWICKPTCVANAVRME